MKISYSSASEFKACQYKWYLRKVLKEQPDADASDRDALTFGSAVHQALEELGWKYGDESWRDRCVQKACEENRVHYDKWYIVAQCVGGLLAHHYASRLEPVGIELPIETDDFIGFIDLLCRDKEGKYWIVDLKTSAPVHETIYARLAYDTQLNLYAHYRHLLASKYPGIVENFAGCAYRVVQKPRSTKAKSASAWTNGFNDIADCQTIYIPANRLHETETILEFREIAKEMNECNTPKRNRQNCIVWNSPCEYWSRCHGGTKTELIEKVIKHEGAKEFTFFAPVDEPEDFIL